MNCSVVDWCVATFESTPGVSWSVKPFLNFEEGKLISTDSTSTFKRFIFLTSSYVFNFVYCWFSKLAIISCLSATDTIAVLLVVGTGELGRISCSNNKLINVDFPAEKWPTKEAVYWFKYTFFITWLIVCIKVEFFDFSTSFFNLYKISNCSLLVMLSPLCFKHSNKKVTAWDILNVTGYS